MAALFPPARLRQVVESLAGTVMKAVDPETQALRDAARSALAGDVNPEQLDGLLRQVFADAYAAGGHAASQQVGAASVTLAGVSEMDWSAWTPGDPAAAALASNGGLAQLLDGAGATVDGIVGSLLDQLGNRIGDGLAAGWSIDRVAGELSGIVTDPWRAEMIAHTETTRAQTAATLDTYRANGIGAWDWILSDGACEFCQEQADGNPHSLSDEAPPGHPWCRCAASPVVESVGGSSSGGSGLLEDALAGAVDLAGLGAEAAAAEAVDLSALSDAELSTRLGEVGDNEQAMQDVLDELDRRDVAAAQAVRDAVRISGTTAEKDAAYDQALLAGEDPLEAYSSIYGVDLERARIENAMSALRAAGYTGRNYEELCMSQFKDYASQAYLAAEAETRGVMLNAAGKAAGVDPGSLFTGQDARARKYASDELLEWWDNHGRLTLEDFKISNLGGKAAWLGQGFYL